MLMIGKTLTAEQRLQKAVVAIMSDPRYVALAGVLMVGTRTVCDDVPTACTNGRDEKYGRDFVDSLSDAELRFLILHENYHKLYRHLTTWRHLYDKDAQCANQACDYVINIKIMDDNHDGFAVIPKGGLYDDKYRGWDSAKVFNDIYDQDQQGKGQGGGNGDSDDGFDSHDWDSASELTQEEQDDLARDIDEAVRQGAMGAGKMGADVPRDLQDLMQPQVDWREVLRDFISDTCKGVDYSTWTRPSRRFLTHGMYMPSGISEQVGELIVAIDTSFSISDSEVTRFLSEVRGICDTVTPERVRILYWGSDVVGDESYERDDLDTLVHSTKPSCGGGTDVDCVTKHIADKGYNAQACIVLTDGDLYSGWGSWAMPVLWAVINNPRTNSPVGKTVHVTDR